MHQFCKKELHLSNILYIDPSLRYTGVVIVDEKTTLIEYKCIPTEKIKDKTLSKSALDCLKIKLIIDTLYELIIRYKVNKVVFELTAGSKSSRACESLALVKGAIIGLCIGCGIKYDKIPFRVMKQKFATDDKEIVYKGVLQIFKNDKSRLDAIRNKQHRYAISDALAVCCVDLGLV